MDLPHDDTIRWVVRRYSEILARTAAPASPRKLVLPTGEFFPDAFDGDAGSVNLLFWRLQEHSGLTDLDVELRFIDDGSQANEGGGCGSGGGGCGTGSCSSGGASSHHHSHKGGGGCGGGGCGGGGGKCNGKCGSEGCACKKNGKKKTPKHDHADACASGGCGPKPSPGGPQLNEVSRLPDGSYRVEVPLGALRSPVTMTASLATSLGQIHLLENGGLDRWPANETMAICELAAINLGFGVLLFNASYIFQKGCHGVAVDRATNLEVSTLAVGLALFASMGNHASGRIIGQVGSTQREAYDEAKTWVDSNSKIVKRLQKEPKALATDDHLVLQDARPWLARVLGIGAKKKKTPDIFDDDNLAALEASLSASKKNVREKKVDPKLEELRALVSESLEEARSAPQED